MEIQTNFPLPLNLFFNFSNFPFKDFCILVHILHVQNFPQSIKFSCYSVTSHLFTFPHFACKITANPDCILPYNFENNKKINQKDNLIICWLLKTPKWIISSLQLNTLCTIVSQQLLGQVMHPSSLAEPDGSPQPTGFSLAVVVTWKLFSASSLVWIPTSRSLSST